LEPKPPPPSAALLSPEQAKERLREIVEGFFFRRLKTEDGKPIRHLLVKSPPGLGKTTAAVASAVHYQAEMTDKDLRHMPPDDFNEAGVRAQTAIFVPRHHLAEEVKKEIERVYEERGDTVAVPILRGRENGGEDGNAPCRRWQEARELGRKGLPIYNNLCERILGGQFFQCPHFAGCEYIQTRHAAYRSPFVILVHSHLGLEWGATAAERASAFDTGEDEGGPGDRRPHFNPRQTNTVICDEDPTLGLIEEVTLSRDEIRGLAEDGLGEVILAGLDHAGGLLSYLRDHGVMVDRLRDAADKTRTAERHRGQIASPDTHDGELEQTAKAAQPLVRFSRVLARLADELASGRSGPAYSLLADGDELIAQGRRPWGFDNQRLLLLDGTANADILRQFIPHIEPRPEIRVQRNARIIQVRDRTFFRGSLLTRASADQPRVTRQPRARLMAVAEFIANVAREGRTLVVTNKPVRCALTGENPNGSLLVSASYKGAHIAHFGNVRGIDEFKDHDTVIVLGREQPSVRGAERRAKAIWYDTAEPIRVLEPDKGQVQYPHRARSYTLRDGGQCQVNVRVHPDPRVQAVIEQAREAEMIQAIDRLRLIHSTRKKTVIILCNIPLDIPVDELVTWRQLVGDGRLEDALTACEEQEWDALPLVPKEMNRLFPEAWITPKAAERWKDRTEHSKNPLHPSIFTIRDWGVLVEYRPKQQKRWSKAIVRHGADARLALAAVLGLPAEDILVKGTGGAGRAHALPARPM
jgi:hypothetical protein